MFQLFTKTFHDMCYRETDVEILKKSNIANLAIIMIATGNPCTKVSVREFK